MGIKLELHLLSSPCGVHQEATAVSVMKHFGDFKEFIAQLVDLREYGYNAYDEPIVESFLCLRGFRLIDGDNTLENDGHGKPFRFIYADQLLKLTLPEGVGPYDMAMMAYLRVIAEEMPDHIIVLYVC